MDKTIIVCPKMYFVLQPNIVSFDACKNGKYSDRHIFYSSVLILQFINMYN